MGLTKPSIIKLDTIDSTNNEVFRLLELQNFCEGSIVVSNFQTAGKGQGQSSWSSEAGKNLTFSILLKPLFLEPSLQFFLNQAIALGVRDGLSEVAPGFTFCIKWPNDIYFENKKVAGILIENRVVGNLYETAVAGVGININQTEFSPELPNPTSVYQITQRIIDLDQALHIVAQHIMNRYLMLNNDLKQKIHLEYLQHLLGLNQWKFFESSNEKFRGKIAGTDHYGKLVVVKENGTQEAYEVKEIKMLLV